MAAPKGHKRYGGRGKGTLNKATTALEAICIEEGIDPFRGLCKLAKCGDPLLSFSAIKELCQYLYPKRKALEVTADIDPEWIEMIKSIESLTKEEKLKLLAEELKKLK